MTKSAPRHLLAALALALGATAAGAQDAPARLDDIQQFASGQAAWEKVCARCHMTGVGPDLSLMEYDVDTLRHFVRNGQLAMPAFPESAIDEATLAGIADYVAKNIYKGEAQ